MDNFNKLTKQERLIRENSLLNDYEFREGKILLESFPKTIFIQAAGPCNSNCVFCSRGNNYEIFDLDKYKQRFETRLFPYISKAEQLILTGSGEFLQLPNSEEILDFFDSSFPYNEKMFSTNGTSLKHHICKKIVQSTSKYTIHVSLHASNAKLHKILTRTNNFDAILDCLKNLLNLRKDREHPRVHLYFVATILNIEDLPNFVRLAHNADVDKVICYYNYIYIPTQKYLSCFFKQDLTNRILLEARELAAKLNMPLELPLPFKLPYSPGNVCREAWSQIMVDAEGRILPCDASEDWNENLQKKDFMDIWNSPVYQSLRKALISKDASCFKHCFRANPACVNNFNSHVIFRGKKDNSPINILWGESFQ